jgi:hypothetical protein
VGRILKLGFIPCGKKDRVESQPESCLNDSARDQVLISAAYRTNISSATVPGAGLPTLFTDATFSAFFGAVSAILAILTGMTRVGTSACRRENIDLID